MQPSQEPGFHILRGPYNDIVRRELTALPGPKWDPKRSAWLVPSDLADEVSSWLPKFKLGVAISDRAIPELREIDGLQLHPFQLDARRRFFENLGGVLSFEMGLGKTPTAISIGHNCTGTKLVICPPAVLPAWKAQLDKFGQRYGLFSSDEDRPFELGGWVVVTTTNVDRIDPSSWGVGFVAIDEAHNIKNYKAGIAQWCKQLRRQLRGVPFLTMTGTLAADTILDGYIPIDIAFPNVFGFFKKFRARYFWLEYVNIGEREIVKVKGLHPLFGDELRRRLSRLVCQATESEQEHLLPPKQVDRVWVDLEKLPEEGDLYANIDSIDFHSRFLKAHARRKAEIGARLAAEDAALGPTALLMYHRVGAEEAFKRLEKTLGPPGRWVLITGAKSPSVRERKLREAATTGANLVVTMAAIKEGIDLTPWSRVVVAEFPYYPAVLLQVLKRFHRLNSPGPVRYTLLVGRGSVDETIYAVVEAKLTHSRSVLQVGGMADSMTKAAAVSSLADIFSVEELSDE